MAEILGTYFLIFAGCASVAVNAQHDKTVTHPGIAIVWGLTVMVLVYSLGHISGAHFNPALTVAFASCGRFPLKQVPAYVISQVIGSTLAAATLRLLFGLDQDVCSGKHDVFVGTLPAGSDLQSFVIEFIITFYLMFIISGVATDNRAVRNLASIAEKKTVSKLLFKTLRELLMARKTAIAEDESSVSGMEGKVVDLLVSLLPGLDGQEVDTVFSSLKPAMQSSDGFVSKNLKELLELMHNICHVSAKRHKLDCLYFLLAYASKTDNLKARKDIVSSFLPEVILALKEVNKKTRSRAYDVLVQIGHAYADEKNGGDNEKLHGYFNMVVGCLAGEKPQMISAAVKGVARLTYEFSDLIASAYNLLPSTFLLLQRKNKEITKANLGLLKMLVAKSPVEGLHANLKSIVEGLLKWPEGTKNLFKAKCHVGIIGEAFVGDAHQEMWHGGCQVCDA
ncbi:hypothetical protein F2Q69_00033464 [Brassica cretica]|uniref:Aquaporin n=1 Tax=Brassica cretica TaxID=69181 RepID=A0A8S9SGL5_BRACR|nr:hypothetical protein F2Q69_00033464 [Brassica cretica]